MDVIRSFGKPALRRPLAIAAFEGWNDACEAASGAVNYLLGHYDVSNPFAVIESEEFFDFQANRPTVEIDGGGTRRLMWPATRFYAVELPDNHRDLIVVVGEEPNLRWKTFSREVTRFLGEFDVDEVILLGAFIGQTPHTVPTPIVGVATDPAIVAAHALAGSSYQGPTGIVGVLMEACRESGMTGLSLWAAAPHYLAANTNPVTMLALGSRACEIGGLTVDFAELETAAEEFEARIDTAIEASSGLGEYIAKLERQAADSAEDLADTVARLDQIDATDATLVSEIEQFLEEQR